MRGCEIHKIFITKAVKQFCKENLQTQFALSFIITQLISFLYFYFILFTTYE